MTSSPRRSLARASIVLMAAVVVFLARLSYAETRASQSSPALNVDRLRTEYRVAPLGIDAALPRFGWILTARRNDERQTAYQILVASSAERLTEAQADLWNSGKVTSARSVAVTYAGTTLRSGQRVYWTVRVWNRDDCPSDYAAHSWFEMGLLDPSDWRAAWISRAETETDLFGDRPAPLFRKEFSIDRPIARARAYVSGLGYYELRLNGSRVGDHVLDPGWTDYSKRVLYSTYDVTGLLKQGQNAVGAMLGRGWYDPLPLKFWGVHDLREHLPVGTPRVILQLQIDFIDGTSQTIVTDASWRCATGEVRRDNVYLGEWVDARMARPGWDRPGFDDADWSPVIIATEPVGPLRAQDAPPIRVIRTITTRELTEPAPGVFIFDLGENFAGWARLRARGPAGARVSLRYGELLYPDGTLNGMTSVAGQIKGGGADYRYDGVGPPMTAWQNDVYITRGGKEEVFTPRFTYHGFRYVEVTGYPGTPTRDAIEGLVLHSDVEDAGEFSCSNETFNQIQAMVRRTELSNLFSVQSDCPHREKFGYGGDLVASSEMAMLNFDMARFYAKTVRDFADATRSNGGVTETAPHVGLTDRGLGGGAGPVEWGTAFPLLQAQLHQYYGDREIVAESEDATRGWIALLESKAVGGILDNGIGDHESLDLTPRVLTGSAFYHWNLRLAERCARLLGHDAEADGIALAASSTRDAFNQRFLHTGSGVYDRGSQACQAFPLYLDLVPTSERDLALDALVHAVEARQGHLSTGIFGTRFMLHALTEGGRAETAFDIASQRSFPGWANMLENGATTLWEHWQFSDDHYSHNHPMFGSVSEWFFKDIAGLAPDSDAVGFDKVVIRPHVVGDLTWARARFASVRGQVTSAWRFRGEVFELTVEIPVGAMATVYVPVPEARIATESDSEAEGVVLLARQEDGAVYRVSSGRYRFLGRVRDRGMATETLATRASEMKSMPSLRVLNPSMGAVRLDVSLPALAPAKLTIYDIAGRVVMARELSGTGTPQSVRFVSTPGVYLVRLTQNGTTITKRVVVLR